MATGGTDGPAAVPSASYAELTQAQRLLVGAFVLVAIGYLGWRPATFNPDAALFSTVVYAAELLGFACAALFLATCWRLRRRMPLPVPAHATVAVLVPTIDEPVDVVRRTLMAAQRMKHAYEVWLLDDGDRLEMQVLAEELGCRYLARAARRHGKPGNLNNALRHTRAQYLAIFDADQVPAPTFLEETLGFFADDRVAVVQTAVDFYNLDSFEHRRARHDTRVWSERTPFFRVVQPGMDRLDAALFCGSCAVVRRRALDDIGGFATGSATTDVQTALRLHKRGWRSVYYARSLAYGLAPATVMAFLGRHLRRGESAMRAWREEGIVLARGLTLGQRLSYLATVLAYVAGWARAVFFVAPVVALITGTLPVRSVDTEFLARFSAYYLLGLWVHAEVARGYGRVLLGEQYAALRFAASVTATWIGLASQRPSRKAPGRGGESAAAPSHLWPQYLLLGLTAVAIPTGLALYVQGRGLPPGALIGSLLWASFTLAVMVAGVRFASRRAGWRRREYRFPLPVPLRVRSAQGTVLGLATDISPLGCRVVGAPVSGARGGDELRGELLLPTGPLPVSATVRTVLADGADATPVALGCEFRWGLSDERSQLEMFLFGSDLQWRLNGFEDRLRTPLERLGDLLGGRPPVRRRLAGRRWSPVLYKRVNAEQDAGVGFISAGDGDDCARTLVSLGMLPVNGRLYAEEVTPAGPRGVVGRVADEQVLETHAAPIYVYKLTG